MDIQIPSGFEADIHKVQQLDEQRQRDPLATADLIKLYERMLGRLQVNENPLFYAALQNNLGEAYGELPTGDRASNLAQAIGRYQEALRFLTPEAAPLQYATTQNNLGLPTASCLQATGRATLRRRSSVIRKPCAFGRPRQILLSMP